MKRMNIKSHSKMSKKRFNVFKRNNFFFFFNFSTYTSIHSIFYPYLSKIFSKVT